MARTAPTLAQKLRADIANWKVGNIRKQALSLETDPDAAKFIIDLMADTTVEELSDENLVYVARGSTNANLVVALGYEGPRSNAGNDLTPFFTAVLNRVKREFGAYAVRQDIATYGYRGLLNTTEVRTIYSEEVKRLVRRLTIQGAACATKMADDKRVLIEAHLDRFYAGEKPTTSGQTIVNQLMTGVRREAVCEITGELSNKSSVAFYASLLQNVFPNRKFD